jgi:hypothetical protein
MDWTFSLLQNFARFGHIDHKIWGYFRQGKITYKQNKSKSFLEARKIKLEE